MTWKIAVCAVLACAAVGAVVLLSLRVGAQADEIDALRGEVEAMRREADFWPALIRVELLRMEARLKAWWKDGQEGR